MFMAAKPVAPSSEVMGSPAPLGVDVQQQPLAGAGAGPGGGPENENKKLDRFSKEITPVILSMVFGAFWASAQTQAKNTPIMLAASFFLLLAFLSCICMFAFLKGPANPSLRLLRALAYISCGSLLLAAFLYLISLSKFNAVAVIVLLLIFVVALCWPGARQGADPQRPDLKDIHNFSAAIVTGAGVTGLFFGGSSKFMISTRFEWAVTLLWIVLFVIIAIGLVLILFGTTVEAERLVAPAINLYNIMILLVAMVGVLVFAIIVVGRDNTPDI